MRLFSSLLTTVALTPLAPTLLAQAPPPAPLSPAPAPPGAVQAPLSTPPPPAPPPSYVLAPAHTYLAPGPDAPTMLPYRDGDPVPDGYHPGMRYRRGMILGGALTFGTTYLASAVMGFASK